MAGASLDEIVRRAVKEALSKSVTESENVTLRAAEALIEKVFEQARGIKLNAFAAVVDAGGNPVVVKRMDGAITASYDIALNKAYTSASLAMSTDKLSKLAAPGGELYGIQHTNGGRIVIFGGGEPLYHCGKVVGALGVSGGTLKQDTELAAFGKKYWEEVLCR